MRLRDFRSRAMADLHREMRVPAFFLRDNEEPLLLGVRIRHVEMQRGGDETPIIISQNPTVIVRADVAAVDRLSSSIISVAEGEAYKVDGVGPAIGGYRSIKTSRMMPKQIEGKGYPVPDDLDWELI